jgi:propanol-preferring alcohol dehydrogenase
MRAMVISRPGEALTEEHRPIPPADGGNVVLRVVACGVCRTDLHVADGELPEARYPVIPGHQAIGQVVAAGPEATLAVGDWAGIGWLAHTCGKCEFCLADRENLCEQARFHGCHVDGGYATHLVTDSRYCLPLREPLRNAAATPLLCAGLIGFRSLRMAGRAPVLGIYGFGSAAHILTQVARSRGQRVFAFTRPGDVATQTFAREMGAAWAAGSDTRPPELLDAAIIFAADGALVPRALRDVKPGGRVVCGGIHMSDIPGFPYRDLWGERQIRSVANLTRADGRDFLEIANSVRIETRIRRYPLAEANRALADLRSGKVTGTAVLLCAEDAG